MSTANPVRKRILFVDDQPEVLHGLRRTLFELADEWHMEFATGGQVALDILAKRPFDVVISGMHMPGVDGADLLALVADRFPSITRILLSGSIQAESAIKSLGSAHQFLSKPINQCKLQDALKRASAVRDLLDNQQLRALLADLRTLPSLPTIYHELMRKMQSPGTTLCQVGELIAQDVGMTTKILQIVNSSFFGLPVHVSSPVHAAQLLGLDILKTLVLSVDLFTKCDDVELSGFSIHEFTRHSLNVGTLAKKIAENEEVEKTVIDNALLGGMLHDLGKLILAQNIPERHAEALSLAAKENIPLWQAEQALLGASHARIGAYLVGLWGLSEELMLTVANHHAPAAVPDDSFSALTAVYLANEIHKQLMLGPEIRMQEFDNEYLSRLNIQAKLPAWQGLATELTGEVQYDAG